MKATITQTRNPDRLTSKNVVYVESPLDRIVDRWFTSNDIMNLMFKCKTWDKVKRIATKAHISALQELFPDATSIRYSRKAGCRCGCSPGYLVKMSGAHYSNGKDHWVDIEATPDEIAAVERQVNLEKHRRDLMAEMLTQNPNN